MDVIDSMKTDKVYVKCKKIVKIWEKDFKTKHNRTPSKFDIKEAPAKIKYAYKKYFQLKSAALENSLTVCDIDEAPITSPELLPPLESTFDSVSPPSKQLLPSLPSGSELEKLLSDVKHQQSEVKHDISPRNPFTDNMSKKLFQNKTFSLRNPRKSLSTKLRSICTVENNIKCNSDIETKCNELSDTTVYNHCNGKENNYNETCGVTLQNTESISSTKVGGLVSNKLDDIYTDESFAHSVDCVKSSQVRQINGAWLKRAIGLNIDESISNELLNKSTNNFGLSNINVQNVFDKFGDFVENSESDDEDNVSLNKLKPALKKRKCIQNNYKPDMDRHKPSFDSHESNTNENTCANKARHKQQGKKERNKRHSKAAKIDVSTNEQECPDITDFLPFGLEENVTPRHINIENVLKTVDSSVKTTNSNKKQSIGDIDKLANKIQTGTLNDNFVKINIEKKVFVRGKKSINFSKYKKQQWKDKKALNAGMEFPESGKISCFKCGLTGHMSRYCISHKGDKLLPLENYDENNIPTLKDMQSYVSKETNSISLPELPLVHTFTPSSIPDSFLKMLRKTPDSTNIKPVYPVYQEETPMELHDTLKMFGHESFRPGQEHAIKRILSGMSTLLILSTGGGKSLCYQIPAYIYSQHYKCITLVISPLVSLMEDQVLSMPEFLRAGCLHTNQPPTQRHKIIQCLKDGEINVLLISPEALISGDASNGFSGLFRSLPQIAFACIDEAHCVSQWSHNFRPSYLMICRILREKLNVKCILGLTATASQSTIKSVINHIDIPDGIAGVITNPTLPDNLCLSVSLERDKDRALVSYLTSEPIKSFNSIIVYCIRRDECERVSALLRSCLQEPGKVNMEKQTKKRKRMSYIAETYHAGMSAAQRKKIQKNFMDGTLRIIVATVAFGMGINKPDIRCIIHYNMPGSFESYVQEVGRAGRDGQPAHCHVFMNDNNSDKNELLKHIHANTIDRPTIRKLLQRVFIACECTQESSSTSVALNISRCKGHEVGIPIDNTVEELDLPSENIATLLCYLELHPKKYIKVLNNAYTMCKIISYGGPDKILEATKSCPPLAMAYLLESKKDPSITKNSIFEFNVIEVAAAIGWQSGMTKYHLKNLEWTNEDGLSKRTQLKVEFNTLGFRIMASGDLSPTELDSMLDDLHECVLSQEKAMLYQLEESNRAFSKFGNCSIEKSNILHEILVENSNELKSTIRDYFQRESNLPTNITIEERQLDIERVTADVRALISSYKDCNFTGRSIARIFQGISSPNYPALIWGRCKYWRSHMHEDFYGIIKIATQQIIQMKML